MPGADTDKWLFFNQFYFDFMKKWQIFNKIPNRPNDASK